MKSPRIFRVVGVAPLPRFVLELTVASLRGGGLILLPTETVYGLAADPRHPEWEARLFGAKRRPKSKPVAMLAYDCAQIAQWGGVLGAAERTLARRYWPGPLTMVLPVNRRRPCGTRALPERGTGRSAIFEHAFEGFRVPDHPVALELLREFGVPLRVTSANLSGEPPALRVERALLDFGRLIELALDAGPAPGGVPSTVVRIADGKFHLLREGAIPAGEISGACEETGLKPETEFRVFLDEREKNMTNASFPDDDQEKKGGRNRVLLVCTGNMCRSPMAEYMLRHHLGENSAWEVESAGTHAVDGVPASREAVDVLREKGVDLSPHRSRSINSEIVRSADLIVAMTEVQADELRRLFPDARDRIFTLASFDSSGHGRDIADPIGSSTKIYSNIRDQIEKSLLGLILHLKSGLPRSVSFQ